VQCLLFRLISVPALLALCLLLFASCSAEEEGFLTELPDNEYPLEEMLLTFDDLPIPMEQEITNTFDNASWAQLFGEENLRGKVNQLEARGRIIGALREFSWEEPFTHLGGPALITVQSTLYSNIDAAKGSMSLFCGTLVDERTATDLTDFWVADIGEGVQGFLIGQQTPEIGRFVETVVCFRTGRVVHAVRQSGLDGTEDIALNVRLARRMYERVLSVFESIEASSS